MSNWALLGTAPRCNAKHQIRPYPLRSLLHPGILAIEELLVDRAWSSRRCRMYLAAPKASFHWTRIAAYDQLETWVRRVVVPGPAVAARRR